MRFHVKIGFRKKDDAKRIELGQHVHDEMTGNAYFVTPNPSLANLQTSIDEYSVAYQNALALGKPLKAILRAKREAFYTMLKAVASYVDSIAQGDAVIITSAGFDTNNAPVSHVMTQVKSVTVLQGLHSGEVLVEWDKVEGARFYLGYIRLAGELNSKWELIIKTCGARGAVNKLLAGGLYEVMIEACGSGLNNVGKLSDPVQGRAAF